jgi:hypothetical protein
MSDKPSETESALCWGEAAVAFPAQNDDGLYYNGASLGLVGDTVDDVVAVVAE